MSGTGQLRNFQEAEWKDLVEGASLASAWGADRISGGYNARRLGEPRAGLSARWPLNFSAKCSRFSFELAAGQNTKIQSKY